MLIKKTYVIKRFNLVTNKRKTPFSNIFLTAFLSFRLTPMYHLIGALKKLFNTIYPKGFIF